MLTAAQIQEALLRAPREERVTLASKLFALVRFDDEETLDRPLPVLSEDREELVTHLRTKRAAR